MTRVFWRNYVVLEVPGYVGSWYVGWIAGARVGISRIPIVGEVRMLRGPEAAMFFAVSAIDGEQLPLRAVALGYVGDKGVHRRVQLH
ncbi:MAG: hypothetical protein WA021_05875 [Minisyncoccia bacterium]